MGVFINLSNHPSENWSLAQKEAALKYGEIIDVPMRPVYPKATKEQVQEMAKKILEKVLAYEPSAVMCQGEFTLTYALINLLKQHEITVLAACSDRLVEDQDGKRISQFIFVQFREY